MKKAMKLAGIGFIIGLAICGVLCLLNENGSMVSSVLIQRAGSVRAATAIQLVCSALYGALCMGTAVLYDSDNKMPLTLISLIHGMICILTFIPLSLFLGWSVSFGETAIMASMQLVGYVIVWLIMYLKYKREIKELNMLQTQNQKGADKK